MTMMALKFNDSKVTIAGKHQDVLIYRQKQNRIETLVIEGTWLGIADKIGHFQKDQNLIIENGDIILLYTDGTQQKMGCN